MAQNLELEGFDVQTASDGAQALEVYNKSVEKPDLILLDLMMPEIDGMSMLKRLRKSSDVPVIILSAKDERPMVIEGFREGADDFVSKPFYIEELMERIRAVLRRGKPDHLSTPSKSGTYLRCSETVARPASMLCQRRARQTDGQRVQAALRACETPRRSHDP